MGIGFRGNVIVVPVQPLKPIFERKTQKACIKDSENDSVSIIWAVATLQPTLVSSNNSTSYCWKSKLTFKVLISPGFVLLFLECGGETVKGVLKVSEFVSTGAVVLFYQVHKRCNRFSHCLLLTPFRYCSYLLFLHCLSISLPPSNSLSLTCSDFLLFLHNRFPPSDQPNLYPSDKSDDVFLLFFTSCPPTSSLSSVLGVHTVFPTYMPCTMCNTFIVTHAHTLKHTHTPTTVQCTSQLL